MQQVYNTSIRLFLTLLYESTGRVIAITQMSAFAQMLKFLVKVFIRLYLLKILMD